MGCPVVLVTAFEAFGGRRFNSSQEFMNAIDVGLLARHYQVERRVLPVTWRKGAAEFNRAVNEVKPEWILAFGEASCSRPRIEALARNFTFGRIADSEGHTQVEGVIDPDRPVILPAPWNADAIVGRLVREGIPVERSDDAGEFLCNRILFEIARGSLRGGFVHLPVDFEQEFAESSSWRTYCNRLMRILLEEICGDFA